MDKAPVVVPQGRLDLKDAPKSEQMEYDTAILKNCGISEEDVKNILKGRHNSWTEREMKNLM